MAMRVRSLVGDLSLRPRCADRRVACGFGNPLQNHLTDLRMDTQRPGDPTDDPRMSIGGLLDKGGNAYGGVMSRSEEVRVYNDFLRPIGDASVKPLLNGRLSQLHVGVVDDAQTKTRTHHFRDLTEQLV